jgi:hypothetical protein
LSEGDATPPVRVTLDELRRTFELVLAHVAEVHGEEIVLRNDYFWSIPAAERYDPYAKPTELTVGQLSESWEWLARLDDDSVLSYALVWLGEILIAIGQQEVT